LVLYDSLVASFGRRVLCLCAAEGSLHCHCAGLSLPRPDPQVKSPSFLDVDDIPVRQLIGHLLLAFELVSDELLVVVGVGEVRLTAVALAETEGKVARVGNGDDDVNALPRVYFKGELVLQGQVNDLSAVDADREQYVLFVFVLYLYPVVVLACKVKE
jgi:hypothetical protein